MEVSSSHQLDVFFLCVSAGILSGVFFDVQRSVRKIACKGKTLTTLQDIMFALFYVGVALYVSFNFNHGEIRYYQVMGVAFGVLLYLLLLSTIVLKIIAIAGKVVYIGVIKPLIVIYNRISSFFKKIFIVLTKAFNRVKTVFKIGCNMQKNNFRRLKKRLKML